MKYSIAFCLLFCLWNLSAQDVINQELIRREGMLLTNPLVEIEATSAMNDMYNFKFDLAFNQFTWFKEKYPEHPLPYFLLGLNEWWKIMPNAEIKDYDERFLQYMEECIEKAKVLYDADKQDAEASFFLSAAYAFKCRLHSERKHWTRATVAGKNALAYLRRGKKINELGAEFILGDALYNYYSVWIPKNYPLLKPILMFFKKGDPQLGIQQLEEVAANAFYTRTEAQYHLMRIYRNEENKPEKALPISEYLNKTFPDNAYFQRTYAAMCYSMGMIDKAEKTSLEILQKIANKMPGYEGISGRYAAFFLAYVYKIKYHQPNMSEQYYKMTINFAENTEAFDSGYYQAALFELGKINHQRNDQASAKMYFNKVKKYTKKKNYYHKEAVKFLNQYKKQK